VSEREGVGRREKVEKEDRRLTNTEAIRDKDIVITSKIMIPNTRCTKGIHSNLNMTLWNILRVMMRMSTILMSSGHPFPSMRETDMREREVHEREPFLCSQVLIDSWNGMNRDVIGSKSCQSSTKRVSSEI
jgi:hypothetical protein